jgi:hypothetical protein
LGNQASFVKVGPTIWTQDLKGRQQLDLSFTFSLKLLLGKQTQAPRPGFFYGAWELAHEAT